ncbi:hypothetical protein GLOIN_2v1700308 [Rhizophagus irregularis DAOM 181602=DAOM 197198]|uniref:Uncharacterized protein n=1 Tax=Rhizophagus irregularis (strain DAOM 181602 / DAOM 197198 / MUCL 43194) TaxID=747089 RepID=A0A2P4P992_RHIID|nr:hypothetical protein GLOIN_2v1700308 [Rhizophagus irregularis DAOM 181602=DAOM 197198]POG61927.1 hypothetical protein GLOIN_2v1700308 [Rhizophagus irregularis DAOM 181602=DAOM 197198]|eukprot:XP_025168793.1 hypothetical protein GLOIN_2v1700308 [Rhizophagus irregularis DAOM 181602=DAOM 197198]
MTVKLSKYQMGMNVIFTCSFAFFLYRFFTDFHFLFFRTSALIWGLLYVNSSQVIHL